MQSFTILQMNGEFPTITDLDTYLNYIKENWSKTYPNANPDDIMNTFSNYSQAIILKTNFGFNKTYVKKSQIHGTGVFALRPIRQSEVFTIYPAHYIVNQVEDISNLNVEQPEKVGLAIKCIFSSVVQENSLSLTNDIRQKYTIGNICGDPRLNTNTDFVGHLLNDAVKGHKETSVEKTQKEKDIYEKLAGCRNNSAFISLYDDSCICLVATRDIQPNEELFTSYGYEYWSSGSGKDAKMQLTRVNKNEL